MDEKTLLKHIKHGNPGVFKEFVEQYQHKVVNTCYGFVHNREDAEDIAQEVFLEVYTSIANFREDAKLSTWLYRISITKSLDFLRRQKRKKRFGGLRRVLGLEKQIEQIPAPSTTNPEKNLAQQERARILRQAVNSLSENQRIAITLHKYEGFSYKEVAEIMKTSVSSVESLIHRAKKNLQKKLYHYYADSLEIQKEQTQSASFITEQRLTIEKT